MLCNGDNNEKYLYENVNYKIMPSENGFMPFRREYVMVGLHAMLLIF
ncbi:hypothetical protein [Streptococcus thoraltensis]